MISYEMNGKIIAEFDKDESFAISRLSEEDVEILLEMVFQKYRHYLENGTDKDINKWWDLYNKVSNLTPLKGNR